MPRATRQSFGDTLVQVGEADHNVVVLDADLSKSTMTMDFQKKFPDRHFEIGIAEQNMIGIAAGLALCGKTPVVTSFACFLIGRLETIRIAVAYNRTNVKLVGTHAGLGIGPDGTSQMGLEDIGAMRSLPNMTILQPADDTEAKQAVEWMLAYKDPVYIRLTRQKMEDVHGPDYQFKIGVADTIYEPKNVQDTLAATIFVSGGPIGEAMSAARSLAEKGKAVRVVNVCTITPFDSAAVVRAATASGRIVTVEDHNVVGGLGSAVCEALAESGKACPVVRIGVRAFGESGSGPELYKKYGLSSEHIVEACLRDLA